MNLERRNSGSPMTLTGAVVSVVIGVVAVVVAFSVLSWVVGVIATVVKVAVIVGLVALAVKFFAWRRR